MTLTKLLFQFSFLKTFGNYEHVDVVPLQTHESGFLRILLESETYLLCMATMLWGPTLWAKTSTNADSWCRSMNRSPIINFFPPSPKALSAKLSCTYFFLIGHTRSIKLFWLTTTSTFLSFSLANSWNISHQIKFVFFCALLCCHYNPFLFPGP